jgi:AraC-like DNA-binding protein
MKSNFKNLPIWVLILGCSPLFPLPSDTTFSLFKDSLSKTIPWTQHYSLPSDTDKIKFSIQQPTRGECGIQITQGQRSSDEVYFEGKTEFLRESWQRFYLRIDAKESEKLAVSGSCSPVVYRFYSWQEKEQPSSTLDFDVHYPASQGAPFFLNCRIRPSVSPGQAIQFKHPVVSGRTYCVETHLYFTDTDSLMVEWYLDGILIWNSGCRFVFPKEFFAFRVMPNYSDAKSRHPGFYLENIAIGQTRLYTIPPRPIVGTDSIIGFQAFLQLQPFAQEFAGEKVSTVRYQLFCDPLLEKPTYDRVVTDPSLFCKLKVPLELDSGSYFWRAAYKNQFGHWGAWSNTSELRILEQRPLAIKLTRLYLTDKNNKIALSEIESEQWYDLHIGFDTLIEKGGLSGFALAQLCRVGYTEGNLTNKGGRFLSESNYVWNISFPLTIRDSFVVYEKREEGSFETKKLAGTEPGLYVDGRHGRTMVDILKKEIRIRIKLLSNAAPGKWLLSGLIVAPIEQASNLLWQPIIVKKPGRYSFIIFLMALLTAVLVLVIFIRRRYRKKEFINASMLLNTNKHLVQYIEEHISEKINVEKIKNDLRINRRIFYQMLRESGEISLPQLINTIRIEQAKKMLMATTKSIVEISDELGFDNSRYFSTIFKKYTKYTPSEYKHLISAGKAKP